MKTKLAPALASLAMASRSLSPAAKAQQQPSEDIDSTELAYPVVITPTRLSQSLGDVPASVTIITADTTRRYGITGIEDALRLVPGMVVSRGTGNEYRINYHRTGSSTPLRLNVLIDGVSAYRPGISRVEWPLLPVALEDVDRIEVTRGPNSAAYGPNSMMAVINILTKHPKDVDQGMASVSVGSHYEHGATARLATKLGDTHLYATADKQRDIGYVQDVFQTTDPDQKTTDTLASGKWTRALSSTHELQIRGFHDKLSTKQSSLTCPFRDELNAILAPVGGVLGGLRMACGATYFDGKVGNTVRWLFGHAEYRPTPTTTFNHGGYGESNSLGRSTFSPRVAVNYHLSESQSLHAVYSQGTRTPDLAEVKSNWTETVTGLTPMVMGSTTGRFHFYDGNPNLAEERITSVELGYLLMLRHAGLTLDSRVFDDRLTQLMSAATALEALTVANTGRVCLTGAETQPNWDFAPRWSSWLSYAFLLNRQASTPVESTQYSRHSGGLDLSNALADDWRLSLASCGSTGNGYKERRYARTDLNASQTFQLGTLPSSSTLVMSYLHTPVIDTYLYSVGAYPSSYNDRPNLHGAVRVSF